MKTEPIDRDELTAEKLVGREFEFLDAWEGRIMPIRGKIKAVEEKGPDELDLTLSNAYGYIARNQTWHPIKKYTKIQHIRPSRMFDIGRGRICFISPTSDHVILGQIIAKEDVLTQDDISSAAITLLDDGDLE